MSEWISVDERLPSTKDYVLVWRSKPHYCAPFADRSRLYSDQDDFEKRGITHWMPLPDPPKQAEDD